MEPYFIPHNYSENGRIFNMFKKDKVTKTLIWSVPVTLIILYVIPVSIFFKAMFLVIFVCPVAAFFLLDIDEIAISIISFIAKKKVYFAESDMSTYYTRLSKIEGGVIFFAKHD